MSGFKWSETADSKEWDEFILANDGSIFHTWAWKRVLETTSTKQLYLACRDEGGQIVAACPFVYRRAPNHLLFLDSLPLSHMAGPVLSKRVTNATEVINSLRRTIKFSPLNPVVSMQVRVHQQSIIQPLVNLGFRQQAIEGLFLLDLSEKTPSDIWSQDFVKHDRQAVKYYEDCGSDFRFARKESEYLAYLNLHEESILRGKERQLIPPEFLSALRANLDDQLKVVLVSIDDKLVAGLSAICDPRNSIVHLAIIGYSRSKNMHSPVIYMDWKILNWAAQDGYRFLNFGPTSPNPSNPVHKLKLRFGGKFVPRYRFTLPARMVPYSLARAIRRIQNLKTSTLAKSTA